MSVISVPQISVTLLTGSRFVPCWRYCAVSASHISPLNGEEKTDRRRMRLSRFLVLPKPIILPMFPHFAWREERSSTSSARAIPAAQRRTGHNLQRKATYETEHITSLPCRRRVISNKKLTLSLPPQWKAESRTSGRPFWHPPLRLMSTPDSRARCRTSFCGISTTLWHGQAPVPQSEPSTVLVAGSCQM
jgi:hypothetical protein